ncbi:hypothetical protein ACU6XY_09465 [Klebsiella aerogenes]
MNFKTIYSPTWANSEQTAINVLIDTEQYGTIQFTANPSDSTDYGPMIYQAAIDGALGEITDYVAPSGTTPS